jgi:hypothetical protein
MALKRFSSVCGGVGDVANPLYHANDQLAEGRVILDYQDAWSFAHEYHRLAWIARLSFSERLPAGAANECFILLHATSH